MAVVRINAITVPADRAEEFEARFAAQIDREERRDDPVFIGRGRTQALDGLFRLVAGQEGSGLGDWQIRILQQRVLRTHTPRAAHDGVGFARLSTERERRGRAKLGLGRGGGGAEHLPRDLHRRVAISIQDFRERRLRGIA